MIEIQTDYKGAELTSVKYNGEEMLHDAKQFWLRHSPILFPIVGRLKDDKTIIDGKTYNMTQHGFARDMEFTKVNENSFVLRYNEDTLKKFPYKFELLVWYEIKENKLEVNYKVKNIDDKKIYFAIGAHPAFKCDYTSKRYSILFDEKEENIKFLHLQDGLIESQTINSSQLINQNKLLLNSDSFLNDAIIMKNINSDKIFLLKDEKPILSVEFKKFPYLAIWSKPEANFICIEPWFNIADNINSNGEFKEKENIIKLDVEKSFECKYCIEFY